MEFEGSYYRRIRGNAVEAYVGLSVWNIGDEIGVGAGAGDVLRPWRAPAEDESAFDGEVEAGGVGLAVVVVVDGEGADEVAADGEVGDGVAVLFAGGDGEEAEGFLVEGVEEEGLGDEAGGAGGEELVGEPGGVEFVGGGGGAAAVYVDGCVCKIN